MEAWIYLSLLSAIIFSVKDILAKQFFQNRDITPAQLVFEQNFIGVAIIFFIFLPHIGFESFFDQWYLFLFKAISLCTSTILYFELLKKFEITLVAPLINLSVIFLLFMSSIFLGEVITLIQLFGIFITIIAVYSLEVIIGHHTKREPQKHHFKFLKDRKTGFFLISIVMLIAFSSAAIFDKLILTSGVNPYTNAYFTCLLIFIALVFYYSKKGQLRKAFTNLVFEPQTLLISFLTFLSNLVVLFAIAVPGALVSLIIPLRRTSTLITSVIGGILFHEKHLFKKLLATLLMVVGVFLIVI